MAIDVGAPAINRGGNRSIASYTMLDRSNLANADGTLDTVQLWMDSNCTGVKVGTFFSAGGTSWTCRDVHVLGDVAGDSLQTFTGITNFDVVTGDAIGIHGSAGVIERDTTADGASYTGDSCVIGNTSSYNHYSNLEISLYGTGTESGGLEEKTSAETGAGLESVFGREVAGGEAGSGVESLHSRSLAVPDAGSGIEAALVGAVVLAGDTGQGSEYARILGFWEVLLSGDAGRGADSLKALTVRAGHDMRIQTSFGHVGLPHKEVNL